VKGGEELAEAWIGAGLGEQKGNWVWPAPDERAVGVHEMYKLATDPQASTPEREGAYEALLMYSGEQGGDARAELARYFLPKVNEYRTALSSDPWAGAATR
jgi:hypothetical protein